MLLNDVEIESFELSGHPLNTEVRLYPAASGLPERGSSNLVSKKPARLCSEPLDLAERNQDAIRAVFDDLWNPPY